MADNYNSYSPQTQHIPAQQGYQQQAPQQRYQQQPQQQGYQQQAQQQRYQQQAPQQRYQQQMPQHSSRWQPMNDITSTGEWFLNLFLVAIPLVGLILLFVWAFSSGTAPSKKNWARANLIWILVTIILLTIMVVVAMLLGVDVQAILHRYYR